MTGSLAADASTGRILIGDLEIDLRFRTIARPDGDIELPHRIFELLLLFVAEPHVLHTRQRLLERAWSGLVVEDANLSQSVWILRKALGSANKDWIRTVSKKGYVFEPPVPILRFPAASIEAKSEALPDRVQSDEIQTLGTQSHVQRVASGVAARHRAWVAVIVLAVVGLAALATGMVPSRPQTVATSRYVLIDGTRNAPDAQARIPARLLEAWLGWKLGACPETRAVMPAEWALPGREPIATILLGSGTLPGDDGRIFVQARIDVGDAHRRIHREGPSRDLARLVDEVSNEALQVLLPARAHERWPTLRLPAEAAGSYLAFREARLARRWTEAVALGERALRDAPSFELARLELAQTHAARGQLPQANLLLESVAARLQPLPADARTQLRAYRLGLSPDHAGAARAYAALAVAHPHRAQFAIQQARALARTGRFTDGLAVLDRMPKPESLAPEHAVLRSTSLAGLRTTTGDLDGARASARTAARIAAEQGWPYERGHALLALANAEVVASDVRDGASHYEAAAKAFDTAGDAFSALHARAIGELHGPPVTGGPVHLEPWLARARAAGQRQLELDALRIAAQHHYRAGDLTRYRERLRQAHALSETLGDRWGAAALTVDRLEDDLARGQTATIDRELTRLAGSGLQGEPMLRARQIEAMVAIDRGEFARALAILDRGQRDALGGKTDASTAATSVAAIAPLACTRASVLVRQGRPAPARVQYARCREGGVQGVLSAAIGLAELEWISGDRAAALAHIQQARARLADVVAAPERWAASVELAGMLVRTGDARAAHALLQTVLPRLQASGLDRDAARARLAMAEVALASGDPVRAREDVGAMHASFDPLSWQPRRRLIDVALSRDAGDEIDARKRIAELHRDAHARGDVMHQMLVHQWMRGDADGLHCTEHERAALVARSGFRGANLDWLGGVRQPSATMHVLAESPAEQRISRVD